MKNRINNDIRATLKMNGIYLYELAKVIGVSEPTIIRWLRVPLSAERRECIQRGIDRLIEAQGEGV